jgi:hypothetical protein
MLRDNRKCAPGSTFFAAVIATISIVLALLYFNSNRTSLQISDAFRESMSLRRNSCAFFLFFLLSFFKHIPK